MPKETAIFIDATPYGKPHTIVPIAPVITKDMDEAVVRRAKELCPKNGRVYELPEIGLPQWKEYDRDRMTLSYFRFQGDEREMQGYREWRRLEQVWAMIGGEKTRVWLFLEQRFKKQAPS